MCGIKTKIWNEFGPKDDGLAHAMLKYTFLWMLANFEGSSIKKQQFTIWIRTLYCKLQFWSRNFVQNWTTKQAARSRATCIKTFRERKIAFHIQSFKSRQIPSKIYWIFTLLKGKNSFELLISDSFFSQRNFPQNSVQKQTLFFWQPKFLVRSVREVKNFQVKSQNQKKCCGL